MKFLQTSFFLFVLINLSFGAGNIEIKSIYIEPGIDLGRDSIAWKFFKEELGKRVGSIPELTGIPDFDEGQIVLIPRNYSNWPEGKEKKLNEFSLPDGPESYRVITINKRVFIQGRDFRGLLFGIGHFLRTAIYGEQLGWKPGDVSVKPDKSIRGHQIGYRNTANAFDAWTPEQYEQYIRDMIVFGANSMENIPFSEDSPIHFTLSNWEMNLRVSEICDKYNMDYWIWSPITFDLNDKGKANDYLKECERFYSEISRLDAVFVPGGDPGNNPPELVLPMMEKMAALLREYHPESTMWLSLQGFTDEASKYVYDYMEAQDRKWMGGLVSGPSSPPMEETRKALPDSYQLRHYPDITHTVRCQYPNRWWDPAFNFVLGREPINPQPLRYHNIYLHTQQWTDGFITYSDGIHDDLNKMIWSQLGVDPTLDIRVIVKDYANYFLDSEASEEIADALFALERNWDGAIKYNGAIDATLERWQSINERRQLDKVWEHWRWKMYLTRALLDSYVRDRFIYEEQLENQANKVMRESNEWGAAKTMDSVRLILAKSKELFDKDVRRNRIFHLSDDLFEVIGFQPSVPLYRARNPERGAYIDFIDRPLNNKWWIEKEFENMEGWNEGRKQERLKEIGLWENPGEGSYYDDIGNVYKSPHVVKLNAPQNDYLFELSDNPGFDWWDSGYNKSRLSWMINMRWPHAVQYNNLDPDATYKLVYTGVGRSYIQADGVDLRGITEPKVTGEKVTLEIPAKVTQDGKLKITWKGIDESHLNWRQHSRVNELWLIKNN